MAVFSRIYADVQTSDILKIMAGMAQYKIGLVEVGNLKLALQPERIQQGPLAASGLMPSNAAERPVTSQDAIKATAEARVAAQRLAEQRLAISQQKTAQSRRRAAGGIGGPNTGKLVDDLFQASKKQRAPAKTT